MNALLGLLTILEWFGLTVLGIFGGALLLGMLWDRVDAWRWNRRNTQARMTGDEWLRARDAYREREGHDEH